MDAAVRDQIAVRMGLPRKTSCVEFKELGSGRIVNQAALSSVTSRANMSLTPWLQKHRELFHRILIPAKLKAEIRDKLDQANINERILFPGLDGLSQWLTRYYSPGLIKKHKKRTYTGPICAP